MKPGILLEWDRLEYTGALALQRELAGLRARGEVADHLLVLEHYPVFTLGLHGKKENLIVPETVLRAREIPVIPCERGGDITYHGPGQVVAYPILHLKEAGLGVKAYVKLLEQAILDTLGDSGVLGERRVGYPGVWVGERKIASIGVAAKRGVVYHGLAINVDLDLGPFDWIHPCGLKNVTMTSLALEREIPVTNTLVTNTLVRRHLVGHLGEALNREWISLDDSQTAVA